MGIIHASLNTGFILLLIMRIISRSEISGEKLESELNSVQQKMDGILNVIQGNTKELEEEKITE